MLMFWVYKSDIDGFCVLLCKRKAVNEFDIVFLLQSSDRTVASFSCVIFLFSK